MSEPDDDAAFNIFQEPANYYPPEEPHTFAHHTLQSGTTLKVRLVGHNPLWGHLLWNAGRTISDYLEEHARTLIHGKCILELGAGAGLPSLVCAVLGASTVVVTDYPDADLIENLEHNIQTCHGIPSSTKVIAKVSGSSSADASTTQRLWNVHDSSVLALAIWTDEGQGFLWGSDPSKLTAQLSGSHSTSGFDVVILADLLFNHSEHAKLLTTVMQTLEKSAESRALVFFTPYRPWLLEKDLAFFDLARSAGLVVEKIMEKLMDKVLFEEDPGVRPNSS